MSDGSITVDTSDFDEVFTNYIAVTGYTVKQGLYYQLRNWLVKALMFSNGVDTKPFPDESMDHKGKDFCSLVAYLMSTSIYGTKRPGMVPYMQDTERWKWRTSRSYKQKNGTYKYVQAHWFNKRIKGQTFRKQARMQYYSRIEAADFAKKHFDMRRRAKHFIGAFIYAMGKALDVAAGSRGGQLTTQNIRLSKTVKAFAYAVEGMGVSVVAQYGYKHETTAGKKKTTLESAMGMEKLVMYCLDNAAQDIIPNMEQKIASDLEKIASGRKVYQAE
jgi:hypothetical protein